MSTFRFNQWTQRCREKPMLKVCPHTGTTATGAPTRCCLLDGHKGECAFTPLEITSGRIDLNKVRI